MPCDVVRCDVMRFNAIRRQAMPCNAMPCRAMPCYAIPGDAMLCLAKRCQQCAPCVGKGFGLMSCRFWREFGLQSLIFPLQAKLSLKPATHQANLFFRPTGRIARIASHDIACHAMPCQAMPRKVVRSGAGEASRISGKYVVDVSPVLARVWPKEEKHDEFEDTTPRKQIAARAFHPVVPSKAGPSKGCHLKAHVKAYDNNCDSHQWMLQ